MDKGRIGGSAKDFRGLATYVFPSHLWEWNFPEV
jgi:hypothetical protein